jgi:hypothetical protein
MKTPFLKLFGSLALMVLVSSICVPSISRAATRIVAWGNNSSGQTNVPPGLTNAIAVAGGRFHSLALTEDGRVVAWGDNSLGQTNVPAGLSNVVAVAAGEYFSLALKSDGTQVFWGAWWGLSGWTTNLPYTFANSNIVAIAAGANHGLALDPNGFVSAWGSNFEGQCNVPAGLSNVVAVGAGGDGSVALKADGTVSTWGGTCGGPSGPAGWTNLIAIAGWDLGLSADSTVVGSCVGGVPVGLSNIVAVAPGMALEEDGTVFVWHVTNVPPVLTNITAIGAGWGHCLAIVGHGPPIQHTLLNNPTMAANGFKVTVPTQSGRVYALEYKTSLQGPNWTALPLAAGNGGMVTLTDPAAAGAQRFYRVRRW